MPYRIETNLLKLKRFFLLLICLLILKTSQAQGPFFSFKNDRKKETMGFRLVKNLIVIPIFINDKGPFNFVLDTGVGIFLITDPTLIDSLQIKNVRSIKIAGFGEGDELSAFVTPSIKAQVGAAVAPSISAAILKQDVFELSSYAGIPIHGLVGYEFFDSFIVRISFQNNSITYYKPETSFVPRKGTKVPISIEDNKPYVLTELDLGDGKKTEAKLIMDTGAGHPISLESLSGMPFKVPAVNIAANLGIGLTGPINGYLGRIKSLKIGKYQLEGVIAAFPDYEDVAAKINNLSRNGNMGSSVLRRFDVVFDYSRSTMYLRPNMNFREPFEHDMSGMELSSGSPDYKRIFISRVEPQSPAAAAGLQKDDEILSINFKPVDQMTMAEIDNIFRSREERSLLIDIMPNNSKKRERVIITLIRRI